MYGDIELYNNAVSVDCDTTVSWRYNYKVESEYDLIRSANTGRIQ